MYFNTLDHLRQQMYGCFERSRDALFNVGDALLSESQARSLPELSLSVFFERSFPSVYEALQDGRINTERLRSVFVQALLEGKPTDEPIWLGIDSSSMQRLEADSSRDRGMIYVPNMPHATKPVSVGYQFSTVMLLPEQPSSWVGILEQRRIGTTQTAIAVGIEQLRALLPLMPGRRVILLADRWYATASFVCACHELNVGALIRLKRHRKLYRAAPPRQPKQRGAPCKHGPLFQGTRPETYGPADAEWEGVDEHGKRVVVSCWTGLHFREAPEVEVRVLRVQRQAARDSKRDPRESWFVWTDQGDIPLEQVRTWYRKRFSQEHGYRFRHRKTCSGPRHTCANRTLELDRGLCLQSVAAGPTSRSGGSASMGKQAACGHPATGTSRDAQHFGAGWHTGQTSQTAWKIARMAHRSG
ncbi:MAG: transposase [Chloroflexi bacterium]|nr:MAG: transposase [Chloroflexota bacterium]